MGSPAPDHPRPLPGADMPATPQLGSLALFGGHTTLLTRRDSPA